MAKKSTPEFDWTVMVYLAGDNNLTEESVFSLTEMEGVQTDGRIAVIAQFDPKSSRIPSHRYVIKGAPAPRTSTGRARPVTGGLGTHAIDDRRTDDQVFPAARPQGSCSASKTQGRGNGYRRPCDALRLHQLDPRKLPRQTLHGRPGRPWSGN